MNIILKSSTKDNNEEVAEAIFIQIGEEDENCLQSSSLESAFYKIKQMMDDADETSCDVQVPMVNVNHANSTVANLFMKTYVIQIRGNANLKSFNKSTKAQDVNLFLQSLPSSDSMQIYRCNKLSSYDDVIHGFTTRFGGISTHPKQKSLNLCCGDKKHDTENIVMENRRRLCNEINANSNNFYVAKASHGNEVWVFEESMPSSFDGIICKTAGVVIAAPAADCNTILLLDNQTRCCGAIHAGWKGILNGVITSTIKSMVDNYKSKPSDIIVSIGPSLSVCCCEFSPQDAEKFRSVDNACVIWKEGHPKPFVDLRKAARTQLRESGILEEKIEGIEICTKCDENFRFFSYRRMGLGFGTHVGYIGLQ